MKTMVSSRRHDSVARATTFLILAAVIVVMVGCASVEYTLSVSSAAGGTVTHPGIGTFTYPAGAVVLLEVAPAEGYRFTHWSGDVSTVTDVNSPTTAITMNGHYLITANFGEGLFIRDWHDLDAVRDNLSGYCVLMNDLDSTTPGYMTLASSAANEGQGWQPIGIYAWDEPFDPFTGTFDGQGYEIRDFCIDRPEETEMGLFACVGEGGIVQNVGVVNVSVSGQGAVGGLLGYNWGGTVTNSYSEGSVTGEQMVGGLVGVNAGTVNDSYSTATLGCGWIVGGLVGMNCGAELGCTEGTLANSYATGKVTGTDAVGGLVGLNGGTVTNCYSESSVCGDSTVGGLAGGNVFGTISNSYARGTVTGESYVGGLVGGNDEGGIVRNSYATGNVTRSSGETTEFGGFVGLNQRAQITNCYSIGSVHYENAVDPTDKGFAGSVETGGNYEMTGNFWDTDTSGQSSTAGNATGKNTTEMKSIGTFDGVDWDIVGVANPGIRNLSYIWNIVDGVTYPFLSWEPVA